jgi:uncharacterized membrane protein SpoIIM required for sporulation
MIIDLDKFLAAEKAYWTELEGYLDRLASSPEVRLNLSDLGRFHYLYMRTSADLARIQTFSSEPEIRRYLESLVERAYGEIHETRRDPHRFRPRAWFFHTFPQTFRRHVLAFWLALAVMALGFAFGGLALTLDTEAKGVLMPWSHLNMTPGERVAMEEEEGGKRLEGRKGSFSSYLMTHNTKVSITTMALGVTYGVGTLILLFYNGVILGAVALDFITAGQIRFLLGWLLPHGSIEIPAILLAGQAGLVMAGAVIGWGSPISFRGRLRNILPDLVTLMFGVALMLVWAGVVEAFLSQYHEPILPYAFKIAFGSAELMTLIWFLSRSGLAVDRRGARP